MAIGAEVPIAFSLAVNSGAIPLVHPSFFTIFILLLVVLNFEKNTSAISTPTVVLQRCCSPLPTSQLLSTRGDRTPTST